MGGIAAVLAALAVVVWFLASRSSAPGVHVVRTFCIRLFFVAIVGVGICGIWELVRFMRKAGGPVGARAILLAVLAGLTVSLFLGFIRFPDRVSAACRDAFYFVVPEPYAAQAYPVLDRGITLAVAALPGVLVAVSVIAARKTRGDGLTRCGCCGHILKGLSEPRCPECGERI